MKKTILLYLVLIFFISCSSKVNNELVTISGSTMGTTYSVKFLNSTSITTEDIQTSISDILKTVNAQMSTYMPNSELSKFNSYRETTWFPISFDLAFVLKESLEICRLSNGALDITIGPLVNLWGFGPGNRPTKVPNSSQIKDALKSVGWENISVTLDPPAVRKDIPIIYCDLSSTAKGFGVDKIAEHLISLRINNYLVEIGGELRAEGNKSIVDPWRIGIAKPDNNSTVQEIITLKNTAMATSGDYWNYFEENGIRYSHTIEPQTGRPITHKLASITVIAETCLRADGLATAIDVMGEKKGYRFARVNNLPAYFITRNSNGFVVNYTYNFEDYLEQNNN